MTEEELRTCQDCQDSYGKVSVSYLMRKLHCTAAQAEDIAQDWKQLGEDIAQEWKQLMDCRHAHDRIQSVYAPYFECLKELCIKRHKIMEKMESEL